MKKIISALLFISLFAVACKKDGASISPQPPTGHPDDSVTTGLIEAGYGHSRQSFAGTAWSLPDGVEMTEKFHQFMYCALLSDTLHTTDLKNYKGVPGGLFTVCFTLHNHQSKPVTIDFPEELIIVSSSVESQNGLILDLGQVIVPANTSITLFAGGFCLNKDRSGPDVYDDAGDLLSWSFGPSAIPASLKEITNIVRSKNIAFRDVVNAGGTQFDNAKYEKVFVIQKAIWEVTDGDGLTMQTKNEVRNISL